MRRIKELQRLILIQYRDQVAQPEMGRFTEQEVLANLVLLIKDGFADGRIFENGTGLATGAVITGINSKGHDFLDEFETPEK
jgi:hypothetical protein